MVLHESSEIFIYVLIDPITEKVRYVGKTNNLMVRYKNHLSSSERKFNTHKSRWINKLLSFGYKPRIVCIENCSENDWKEREKYWIEYYKNLGCELTNLTDGGDGCSNISEETRIKKSIAASNRTHPKIVKNKISLSHMGIKKRNSKSQYRGVGFHNRKWQVTCYQNKKKTYVGIFEDETDAAKAYDYYVLSHNIPSPTNFGCDL